MTERQKALAIAQFIIFLQRDLITLQTIAEEHQLPWRELLEKAVQNPSIQRESSGQQVWIQQAFVDSKSDSDLIDALHRAFLTEG